METEHKIYGITGKNGDSSTFSTEISCKKLLEISSRQNFDNNGGLDINRQLGINRAVNEKHYLEMCESFDEQVSRNYPIENGSVILASIEDKFSIKILDENTGFAEGYLRGLLPAIDRQHTIEAFKKALANPAKYPNLFAYLENTKNTISVRIVQCDNQDALRRCNALNTGNKVWAPVETLIAMTLDAKLNEAANIKSHVAERPSLVMYQFCHDVSNDKKHPLYKLLPVDPDPGVVAPRKN